MPPILTPPLGFGLANLAALGWFAAAAAPILIHLWMRHTRRETTWAAVRFLQAAIQRRARRLKIQEWVLLAMRTALVALVVLAACKPFLDSWGALGAGARVHHVLVLDSTMSMGLRDGTATLLERARQQALNLLDQSGRGDVFSVIVFDHSAKALTPRPLADRARLRGALVGVEQSAAAGDLARAIPLIQTALETGADRSESIDSQEVVIFSDLARSTWGLERTQLDALKKIADLAAIQVIDLGAADPSNAAVVGLQVAPRLSTGRTPLTIRAQVSAFGGDAAGVAELVADGIPVAERPLKVSAGSSGELEFAHRFDAPGTHTLEVRLSGDGLSADDHRVAPLELPERVRVLCVEERPGDARMVARALAPDAQGGDSIEPTITSTQQLAARDLSRYVAIFYCNVPELSATDAERLGKFLEAGGGAVFLLGDLVDAEAYNRVLGEPAGAGPAQGGIGWTSPTVLLAPLRGIVEGAVEGVDEGPQAILPVRVGQAVSQATFRLDPLGYSHPIVAPFRGRQRSGLIDTPVSRYFRLTKKSDAVEAVVALPSGDPLIAVGPSGAGRVAVVATAPSLASIDPETGGPWTAWPAWPSFLPVVRGLLTDVARDATLPSTTPGGSLIGTLDKAAAGAQLAVTGPDGATEAIAADPATAGWSYARTDRLGVYRIADSGSGNPLGLGAVNADPAESDTAHLASDALPPEVEVFRGQSATAEGETLAANSPVHRMLIYAALTLALLETALASRWGRGLA